MNDSKKRIFIFIDDLDRLDASELVQIFKLVRAVANFKNVTYILACDLQLVAQTLSDTYKIDGTQYLEKIIQLPLTLPKLSRDVMKTLLFHRIRDVLNDNNLSNEQLNNWFGTSIIQECFRTPRDINRLYNILLSTLPMVQEVVDSVDFIMIEIIYLFYRPLWELILQYNYELIYGKKCEFLGKIDEEKKDEYCLFMNLLFPNAKMSYCSDSDAQFIHSYGSGPRQKEKRIYNPETFYYYFNLAVDVTYIVDQEIMQNLQRIKSIEDLHEVFQ